MTYPDVSDSAVKKTGASDSHARAVPILGGYKVVLRTGEDISASLSALLSEYKIKNARVCGFGAVECVDFNSHGQKSVQGVGNPKNLEVVSLTGVLDTGTDGSPKADLKISFGGEDFLIQGGSFSGAKVSYSFEIFLITDPRYSSLLDKFQTAALSSPGPQEVEGGFELVLGSGDSVWDKLSDLMESDNIQSATIIASGKLREATFGFYNSEASPVYHPRTISAASSQTGMEVVSMIGSLARKKNLHPFPHIHASVRTSAGKIEGGHFLSGKADCLKVLVITDPQLFYRMADPAVYGANVFQLPKLDTNMRE